MKFRHNWMNCINRYETIYKKYPDSEQAPWAMYRTALLYQGLSRYSGLESDLDKSIEIYRQVTEKYETHRLADDAQYKIGKILYEVIFKSGYQIPVRGYAPQGERDDGQTC